MLYLAYIGGEMDSLVVTRKIWISRSHKGVDLVSKFTNLSEGGGGGHLVYQIQMRHTWTYIESYQNM